MVIHSSPVTREVLLLLHASCDSMASGPCSNPWVYLTLIAWLGNLISGPTRWLIPINRTGWVPLHVLADRLEVEASELSERGLEDHLLVPDSGPARICPLIRNLLEDVLHHVDLTCIVYRLVIKSAVILNILFFIVPRLANTLDLTLHYKRVRCVSQDILLIL